MAESAFRGVIVPFSRRDQLEYTVRELSPAYVAVISSQELLEEAACAVKALKASVPFTVHYWIHDNLEDPEEALARFDEALGWLKKLGLPAESIATDITGGLVPTRLGVNMGAIFHNVNTVYQYMEHREKDGGFEFVDGTKRMIRLDNPLEKSGLLKGSYAAMMFNRRNYRAASLLLSDIVAKIEGNDRLSLYEGLKKVSDAYWEWDRADYTQAYQLLGAAVKTLDGRFVNDKLKKKLRPSLDGLHGNIRFLQGISAHRIGEKRMNIDVIVDVCANAKRRIVDEERFDDGVARLYRAVEMIVQLLLVRSSVDYLNVEWNSIRKEVQEKFVRERNGGGGALPEKLGLWDGLILLGGYNAGLLEEVFGDRELLLKLLRSRNQSILAHGMKPVSKSTASEFLAYTERVLGNLLRAEGRDWELLRDAEHVTIDLEVFG